MSWSDKRFIEEYLCNRTKVYYMQIMLYDSMADKTVHSEFFRFDFKCELMEIVNDKIRVHYWVPLHDENYKSVYWHDYDGELEPAYNTSTVFFWRSSGFSA